MASVLQQSGSTRASTGAIVLTGAIHVKRFQKGCKILT
jgi:hypothetical protein